MLRLGKVQVQRGTCRVLGIKAKARYPRSQLLSRKHCEQTQNSYQKTSCLAIKVGTTIIEEPSHILGAILISKQTILLFTNKGSICDFYLDGVSRNKTALAVFVMLLEL